VATRCPRRPSTIDFNIYLYLHRTSTFLFFLFFFFFVYCCAGCVIAPRQDASAFLNLVSVLVHVFLLPRRRQ
jgi:hypothetical protein